MTPRLGQAPESCDTLRCAAWPIVADPCTGRNPCNRARSARQVSLDLRDDDLGANVLHLSSEFSKTKDGRAIPIPAAPPSACSFMTSAGLRAETWTEAGVPRHIAMQMVGHKTEAIYRRYNIVNEKDLHEAGEKLTRYVAALAEAEAALLSPRAFSQPVAVGRGRLAKEIRTNEDCDRDRESRNCLS
jgi:hypothetical protein